jgi:glycosyltransferase involved in cell wall biosynthesis
MELSKKKILLFADWFVPGYKAGGPIRSCLHFVQKMKEKYHISVITTDRDLNAATPYENIELHRWTHFDEGVQILYASPQQLSWKSILQLIKNIQPDFIYLNSMYSRYFTIYPLLIHRIGLIQARIILAPRGMLKKSALQFHKSKKRIFLGAVRLLGISSRIHFHATDQTEVNDIFTHFGKRAAVTLAANFSAQMTPYPGSITKRPNELTLIFIGRIHPIKNLDYLLNLLPSIKGNISLTIVGNEENAEYTALCKNIVHQLPENIRVRFAGEVPNNHLPQVIQQHHIFALPTQGENFGHAIFEALAAGKPVLVSDQTPWRNLTAARVGWDLPLQQKDAFINALQQAVEFDQQQYDAWSLASWNFAGSYNNQIDLKEQYYNLFN